VTQRSGPPRLRAAPTVSSWPSGGRQGSGFQVGLSGATIRGGAGCNFGDAPRLEGGALSGPVLHSSAPPLRSPAPSLQNRAGPTLGGGPSEGEKAGQDLRADVGRTRGRPTCVGGRGCRGVVQLGAFAEQRGSGAAGGGRFRYMRTHRPALVVVTDCSACV